MMYYLKLIKCLFILAIMLVNSVNCAPTDKLTTGEQQEEISTTTMKTVDFYSLGFGGQDYDFGPKDNYDLKHIKPKKHWYSLH